MRDVEPGQAQPSWRAAVDVALERPLTVAQLEALERYLDGSSVQVSTSGRELKVKLDLVAPGVPEAVLDAQARLGTALGAVGCPLMVMRGVKVRPRD